MGSIYFIIVVFLLCLAVFDLFVGVSNDAVNFLQSAVGARVAKFRTVLIIAPWASCVISCARQRSLWLMTSSPARLWSQMRKLNNL